VSNLSLRPLTLKEANGMVASLHRHHKPVVGHRFSIGCFSGDELVGAAIIGRPVARMLNDGYTAEVNRLVTNGHKNACSMLYSAAWRAWSAMGGTRIVTYILMSETGTSLIAAGWEMDGLTSKHSSGWAVPSRQRQRANHDDEIKQRWVKQRTDLRIITLKVDPQKEARET
jgi:hypothetical protein